MFRFVDPAGKAIPGPDPETAHRATRALLDPDVRAKVEAHLREALDVWRAQWADAIYRVRGIGGVTIDDAEVRVSFERHIVAQFSLTADDDLIVDVLYGDKLEAARRRGNENAREDLRKLVRDRRRSRSR